MESHRFVDAFLELQQLRLVAPRYPGLTKLLTKAAQAAAGSRQHSNGCSMRRVSMKAATCLRICAVMTSGCALVTYQEGKLPHLPSLWAYGCGAKA